MPSHEAGMYTISAGQDSASSMERLNDVNREMFRGIAITEVSTWPERPWRVLRSAFDPICEIALTLRMTSYSPTSLTRPSLSLSGRGGNGT